MGTTTYGAKKTTPLSANASGLQPVHYWAGMGAVVIAISAYFGFQWVFSDLFTRVPSGPDLPPEWMRIALRSGEVIMASVWLFCFYKFVFKPWRHEGRLSTDGYIVIGCTLVSVWDPLTNTGQYWFTYNSYLLNYGTITSALPFNLSHHAPGENAAFPLLFLSALYGNFVLVGILLCWLMRLAKSKWPQMNTFTLLVGCYLFGMVADFIIEAVVLVPLGFWAYGGGHFNVNAGHYYQFPMLNECFFAGAVFTAIASIRYFVDDRGQTLFERGMEKLKVSKHTKGLMRGIAIIGGIHIAFVVTFHIPNYILSFHATQWPEDLVNRSYFTNRICGPEVNRACPGPKVPIARPDAPKLNYSGMFTAQ